MYKNLVRVRMSRSKVKGQGHHGQKRKTAESSPLTMHSYACVVGRTQQVATDDTIAWRPGVTGYTGNGVFTRCDRRGDRSRD